MATPKAVLEQQKRAEELHRQMYGGGEQEEQPTETPREPERAPATEQPSSVLETGNEPPMPGDAGAPAPKSGDVPDAELRAEYERLRAAHATLQGKYKAEVPRLTEQVRQLTQQVQQAEQKAQAATERAEQAKRDLAETQDRLRDEFGDDATNAIGDYARKIVSDEIGRYREEETKTAEEKFFDQIRFHVTDFDAVNHSPEFIAWLKKPDPRTGFSFQDSLNRAGQARDLLAVVEIFKAFKRDQQPQPPTHDAPGPEQYVAPPRNGGTPPPTDPKPQYTPQDYANLMRRIERGEFRTREERAEARRLEREIHAAITAG